MSKKNKRIAQIICIIMVILMIVPLLITGLRGFAANSNVIKKAQEYNNQKLNDQIKKLNDLAKQKEALQKEKKSLQSQRNDALEDKALLDKQVKLCQEEIDTLDEILAELENDLIILDTMREEAEDAVTARRELVKQRVRATYEAGEITYLNVIFGSKSFSDMLTGKELLERVMEKDIENIEQLEIDIENLEQVIIDIEKTKQTQEEAIENQKAKKSQLEKDIDEANDYIKDLSKQISQNEKDTAAIEAQEKAAQQALESSMKKLDEEAKAASGNFAYPVSKSTPITSKYGLRTHPITGKKNSMHTGVDFGASYGTRVNASKAGTVHEVAYSSTYGNYIIIDHGGKTATLYAHLAKAPSLKKGDKVTQGQKIGEVGSTGMSTGAHLHFEIWINGTHVNPMDHLK